MPKSFDNRIGTVSNASDREKDLRFASDLNRFVMVLAAITAIVLFFW
jgi:hypothetical protein